MNLEELLDAKAVQKVLRCSRALVYKLSKEGRLPSIRIPQESKGGRPRVLVRFRSSDVRDLIEANYHHGRRG